MANDPSQPDLFGQDVRAAADAGMAQAADHADRVNPGWTGAAEAQLRAYASQEPTFAAEDVRAWAHRRGLPHPPTGRAWGMVIRKARKAGVLVPAGFRTSKLGPGHAHPIQVWRSTLCEGRGHG
jgi:hypothetical protein